MSDDDPHKIEDEGPWWRLDFTMVLVLLLLASILLFFASELWHQHFGSH